MPTRSTRFAALVAAALAAALCGARPMLESDHAVAQEQSTAERVQSMTTAFQAIADRSSAGDWQGADAAYNDAVDMMDLQRGPVELVAGEQAADVFNQVDTLLNDLDAVLRAEDNAQVRAVIGFIQARLARLAPALGLVAPPEAATDMVLRWRRAQEEIAALAQSEQWRDMRNASMDLTDDIARRGPAVAVAAGGDAELLIDQARVFAMRLRSAALGQSPDDAALAARFFRDAVDGLLVRLGVLPRPEPTPTAVARMRFRVFQAQAALGDIVTMPIVAEGIPQIGLGAYRVRVHWSPIALRLIGASWDVDQGTLRRDDAAGTVELSLPPAPTGPSGDQILARLQFEVVGTTFDVRGYLPANEIAALEEAAGLATVRISEGDIPQAANLLTGAYAGFVDGRIRPGSLYDLLDQQDLADTIARRLLVGVDLASQPSDVDLMVASLAIFRQTLVTSLDVYRRRLSAAASLPVTLEVLAASDTKGNTLPILEVVPGGVLLDAGVIVGRPGSDQPTVPADLLLHLTAEAQTSPDATDAPSPGTAAVTSPAPPPPTAAPRLPLPLVVTLLAAGILGVVAMWWSSRRGEEGAD